MSIAQYGRVKLGNLTPRVTVLQKYPDGDLRVQLHDTVGSFIAGQNIVVPGADFTELAPEQLYPNATFGKGAFEAATKRGA